MRAFLEPACAVGACSAVRVCDVRRPRLSAQVPGKRGGDAHSALKTDKRQKLAIMYEGSKIKPLRKVEVSAVGATRLFTSRLYHCLADDSRVTAPAARFEREESQHRGQAGVERRAPRRGRCGDLNSLSLSVYQKRLARLCDGWKPEPIRPCVRAVPERGISLVYLRASYGTHIYCVELYICKGIAMHIA